jgi:pyruvate dehydrogenase E1 component alpha subunit
MATVEHQAGSPAAARGATAHETSEDRETLSALYRMMVLIRRFEEKAEEMYTRAKIGGYCHLAIGEEATVVGAISVLDAADYLFASYRDHGVALARGAGPDAVMAELFGKEGGLAHGRGGSMHLIDVPRRFLGGYGIVGGQLPLAVGAALAIDYRDRHEAVLCLLGDGAVNIGSFHESLNLAAIWHLPVVFLVVNNQYGMGTSVALASAEPDLYKRAAAYRMHGERVDGMDLLAVRVAMARLLQQARDERRPGLLEAITYRYHGHSVADAGKLYRTAEEMASWLERDPIPAFRTVLEGRGAMTADEATRIDDEVEQAVQRAVDFANQSPDPDTATLYGNIYSPEATAQFERMRPGSPFGASLPTTATGNGPMRETRAPDGGN